MPFIFKHIDNSGDSTASGFTPIKDNYEKKEIIDKVFGFPEFKMPQFDCGNWAGQSDFQFDTEASRNISAIVAGLY